MVQPAAAMTLRGWYKTKQLGITTHISSSG